MYKNIILCLVKLSLISLCSLLACLIINSKLGFILDLFTKEIYINNFFRELNRAVYKQLLFAP